MTSSKFSRGNEDFISNIPDNVTDKILELLPIRMAARVGLLSKQWRRNWLSLKRLIFDMEFTDEHINEDELCNWQECCNIISGILLSHNGPIHEFNLYIPGEVLDEDEARVNLGHWLSFLSKNELRRIKITNRSIDGISSSHIYWLSELVQLELDSFSLNPLPTSFNGFPKLQHLVLVNSEFTQEGTFGSLMTTCRKLATLRLLNVIGMDHIVIDSPSLETLIIDGAFVSLAFKDVHNLKSLSVSLRQEEGKPMAMETVDAIHLLAISCQLQCIQFGGDICKLLAAGGIRRPLSVAFNHNHLIKLSLKDLDLDSSRVLRYVFRIAENFPHVKELNIIVQRSKNAAQLTFGSNNHHKLNHLVEVMIDGITGSTAELKLVEYLLASSNVLENLAFRFGNLDIESMLKMSLVMMGFPRASPKARLVRLSRIRKRGFLLV